MEQLSLLSEVPLARASPSPALGPDLPGPPGSCGSTFERFARSVLDGCSGRTCRERSRHRTGRISDVCSQAWMSSGTVSHGEFWTRSSSEWPSDAAVSSLSDVLEMGGAQRACEVLFEPEGLRRDPPSCREKREALAAAAGKRVAQPDGALNGLDVQSRRVFDAGSCGPTLSSGTNEGMNIQPSVLTTAPTLTAQRERGAQPPNVLAVRTANTSANGCGISDGVSHTVDASGPEAVAYGFKHHVSACAGTTGFEEELCPTQIAGKPPAVVMTDTQPNSLVSHETCGTLTSRMYKDPPVVAGEFE